MGDSKCTLWVVHGNGTRDCGERLVLVPEMKWPEVAPGPGGRTAVNRRACLGQETVVCSNRDKL